MAHNPWQRWKRGQARDGVVTRPPQRDLDRHRLRHLLDAIGAVSTDMDARTVLHRIVEAATDLVAARYGALGVLNESGKVIDLITVGIDDPRPCAAMGMPQGHGLLHTMVDDREPLRVADVAAHPRSAGFPPGHRSCVRCWAFHSWCAARSTVTSTSPTRRTVRPSMTTTRAC
jgi:hypothetical protein